MAVDVTTLGIRVDTSDLKRGGAALDQITAKGAKAEGQMQDLSVASTRAAGGLGKSSNSLRMASMQLSQVAQQGAATGNYLQALMIQIPDLALGFGAIGIAAGALVPILYGVAQGFMGAGADAKSFDEILDDLSGSIRAYKDATESASQSAFDLRAEFGGYADEAARVLEIQRELAALNALQAMDAAAVSASQNLRDLRLLVDDVLNGDRPLTNSIVRKLNDNFSMTIDEAGQVLWLLDRIGEAQGPDAQARAIREAADALRDASGGAANMNADVLAVYNSLRDAERAALELAAADPFGAMEDSASGLIGLIGEAFDLAGDLTAATNDVVDAMAEAAGIDLSGPFATAITWARALQSQVAATYAGMSALNNAKYGATVGRGRGADPRQFTSMDEFRGQLAAQDAWTPPKVRGSGGRKGRSGGGGRSSADREALEMQREAERLFQDTRTEVEKLNAELERYEKLKSAGAISQDTYNRAVAQTSEELERAKLEASGFAEISDDLKDAVLDFASGGADAMDAFAQSIKRAALEALLFGEGPLAKMFGTGSKSGGLFSGILGGLFGGFRASGGPVESSKGYIVGENGPEWFQPGTSGSIVPNHALGGGIQITPSEVTLTDDGKWMVKVRAEVQQMGAAAVKQSVQAVDASMRRTKKFGGLS